MAIPYQKISEALVDSLITNESIDEVEVDGKFYCFSKPKMRIEYDRVYTGVEMMGDRESFLKRSIHVGAVNCKAVYDSEGERIDCPFDSSLLNLNYQDDDISISYN